MERSEMTPQRLRCPQCNGSGLISRKLSDQLERNGEWQPISTAPKDGTEVLLAVKFRAGIPGRCLVGHWMRGGHCIEDHPPIAEGWYFWNGCLFDEAAEPLYWQPLPKPPEAK